MAMKGYSAFPIAQSTEAGKCTVNTLCKVVRPSLTSILDMTLNNLMMRFK